MSGQAAPDRTPGGCPLRRDRHPHGAIDVLDLLPVCGRLLVLRVQLHRAAEVLEEEVRGALSKLSDDQKQAEILFAYEPVWAIGENGIPASADYADARQAEIIAVAESVLGRRVPCLYGGSVNPGNCEELIACPHIDGLFIGRSAWNVEGYLDILAKCAAKIRAN